MTVERFSTSFLWDLQHEAYTQFGITAWSQHGVPFYLTSNPHTARQYAHVVLGYLRDLLAHNALDVSEPVYLFDLGAGTGRFGYLILKELLSTLPLTSLKEINVKYILTDISEDNITFWKNNSHLKPYFESGHLDCAYFRHNQKEPIHLMKSQITLFPQTVVNPIVLLANYFFDTIPQDFFRIENGVLQEGLVGLKKAVEGGRLESVVDSSPEQINRLDFHYEFQTLSHPKYYADPVWNQILHAYAPFGQNLSFLIPVGAFEVVDYFRSLSQSRMLVIGGDQGVVEIAQMLEMPYPRISLHGTFSVAVNYHALKLYLKALGGTGFLTTLSDPTFVTIVGIMGGTEEQFPETKLSFREYLDRFEPQDYWFLAADLQESSNTSLNAILRLSKFGDWDPINFMVAFEKIRQELALATPKQIKALKVALERVESNYYPISKEDAAFYTNLGVLAYEIGDHPKAIDLFKKAGELAGESAELYSNLSASYRVLGDLALARDYFFKAQRLNAKNSQSF